MSTFKHAFMWLLFGVFLLAAATSQAATVSYILDNVTLEDGEQITGRFSWDYDVGDFEGGVGTFSQLYIPYTTVYTFEDGNLIIEIATGGIDVSGDGNYHDHGLDIKLVFDTPLTPDQVTPINTDLSKFDCCGNGFHKQDVISGTISPVPIPAGVWLFGSALVGLAALMRKKY